ncbi:MAG: hypothetical protein AB1646_26585, partial [Thermodesulfobacteriota bacterium]
KGFPRETFMGTLGIVRLPLVAAEKAGSSRRRWGSIFMLGCGRVPSSSTIGEYTTWQLNNNSENSDVLSRQ